jgi:hypothetical protein
LLRGSWYCLLPPYISAIALIAQALRYCYYCGVYTKTACQVRQSWLSVCAWLSAADGPQFAGQFASDKEPGTASTAPARTTERGSMDNADATEEELQGAALLDQLESEVADPDQFQKLVRGAVEGGMSALYRAVLDELADHLGLPSAEDVTDLIDAGSPLEIPLAVFERAHDRAMADLAENAAVGDYL